MQFEVLGDTGTTIVVLDILRGMIPPDVRPSIEADLSRDHRLLIPDFASHFEASEPEGFEPDALAATIEEELARRGIGDYVALGHSFTAYYATKLALRGNRPPSALILLGAALGLDDEEREQFPQFAGALRAGHDLSHIAAERWVSDALRDELPDVADHIRDWLSEHGAEYAALLDAAAAAPALHDRLGDLDIPVLLRVGSDDVAAPPQRSRNIAGRLRDAEVEVVDGAGHLLMVEDHEATAASVRNFLTKF